MGIGKRRSAEQIQRALREADRDLAKGLVVGDVCRPLIRSCKADGFDDLNVNRGSQKQNILFLFQ